MSPPSTSTQSSFNTLERVRQWAKSSPVMDAAVDVLCEGGAILCPTLVGYTVIALDGEVGMNKLDQVKGRQKKPYGIGGNEATFTHVFNGLKPPFLRNDFCKDTGISFVSAKCVAPEVREQLRVSRAVGPSDEVAMWINGGPVFDTIAERIEEKYKCKRFILGASGNVTGQGNPKCSVFCLDAVDEEIRTRVDMVIDIPHWSDPDLDDEGRWYSAPMFDIDTGAFRRLGKNMEEVNIIVSLFNKMDKDGSKAIDLGEFKSFFKSGSFGNDLSSLPESDFEQMFQLIDGDGSGEIDFEEMYSFLSSYSLDAFLRLGKNMETVDAIVSLFNDMDTDESKAIDLEEFMVSLKTGRFGDDLAGLSKKEFEKMFQLIDKDESGDIDVQEMYSFLSNRSHSDVTSRTLSSVLLESAKLELRQSSDK